MLARTSETLIDVPDLELEMAFQHALERHELLRCCFASYSRNSSLRFPSKYKLDIEINRYSSGQDAHVRRIVTKYVNQARTSRFDLLSAPLWQARIYRIETLYDIVVIAGVHFMVDVDGLLLAVENELPSGYRNNTHKVVGTVSELDGLDDLDFTRRGEEAQTVPVRPALPYIHPIHLAADNTPIMQEKEVRFGFDPEVSAIIHQVAMEHRVTSYSICAAAWAFVLIGVARGSSVTLGMPALALDSSRVMSLVPVQRELFVPIALTGDPTISDFLIYVFGQILRSRKDLQPFEVIARFCNPSFDSGPAWPDLMIIDGYLESTGIYLGNSSGVFDDAPSWLKPETGGGPLIGDIEPESMESWLRHTAPWLLVSESRDSGILFVNRATVTDQYVEALVGAFKFILMAFVKHHHTRAWGLLNEVEILLERSRL